MVEFSISNARYTYAHNQKYPAGNADMHHIILRSGSKYFFVYASTLLVLACAIYLYFLEVCLQTNFLCHTDLRILKILWLFPCFFHLLFGYIPYINRKNQLVLYITACFLTYFLPSCYFESLLIKVSTWLTGHVMLWNLIVIFIVMYVLLF
jgi:hypothetical protein